MRTQEAITSELRHIDELNVIQFDKILEGTKTGFIDKKDLPEFEPSSGKFFDEDSTTRFAYLAGRMDGLKEALKWVLSESGDLQYTD